MIYYIVMVFVKSHTDGLSEEGKMESREIARYSIIYFIITVNIYFVSCYLRYKNKNKPSSDTIS